MKKSKKKNVKNTKKNYFMLFNKIKIEYGFIITLIFTFILFGAFLAIRRFYPFTSTPYNGMDFDSGYVPTYYKLWDILHFKSSAFFDWNLGLGLNVLGSMIANGFLSPLCWIIGLFPRSYIPYAMIYVYLIKLFFISGACYYSIGKIMPNTEQKYKFIFTLMYTFSSYMLLMFCNILYFDAIGLFPILVYGLKELLENERWKLFFVTLVLILIYSYYMAWMSLFFIIGTSTIYLLVMKTDRKKEKFIKVILLSIFSLFIGAFSFIPGFMLAFTSYRMSTNTLTNSGFDIYECFNKLLHLISMAIPFTFFVKQMFVKKDKRINLFFALEMFYLLIGIVIEPINALWHTGSHSGFPFREGFIPIFVLILIALYYLNNNKKYKEKFSFSSLPTVVLLIFIYFVALIAILNIYMDRYPTYGNSLNSLAFLYYPLILFVIIFFTIIFSYKCTKKVSYFIIVFMFLANTLPLMSMLYEYVGDGNSLTTQKISSNFNLDNNDSYNYKIDVSEYNVNGAYILNIPTMVNRLHFIKKTEIDFNENFDYFHSGTSIYSVGGNVLTDLLIQNKYILTDKELPDSLYTLKKKVGNNYYYEAKYNLNYLTPYNGNKATIKGEDGLKNSNEIYKTYFDKNDDLFETVNVEKKNNKYLFDTSMDSKYVYYIYMEYNKPGDSFKYTLDYANANYNLYSNNGIITVFNIKKKNLSFITDLDVSKFKVYRLDVNKYADFVNEINTLNVKVETNGSSRTYDVVSDKNQSVIIPVNYDDCFKIYVNGDEVSYKLALVNYISVDVKKGNNKIEIKYSNKWLKIGIILTIVSIIFFALLLLINKKIDLLKFKFIKWPLFIIVALFVLFFFIKVYILSWI